MDVSIIFVNYKTKDLTINAIKSVIEKTAGVNYEIFVVDNNSQDGSIEVIEKEFNGIDVTDPTPKSKISTLPQGEGVPVYIIKNTVNAGFGAANNLAIKQASGKYVLCLNTDTLLINNAIKIMFDFMEKEDNQQVAACGCYLSDTEGNAVTIGGNFHSVSEIVWKFGLRKIFPKKYLSYAIAYNGEQVKYIKEIDYITGADIFLRKSILDEVGIFDEDYFMYSEEMDLCYRIKKAGYILKFVEDAKIIHMESKSVSNNYLKKKMLKESELLFFKKHKCGQIWIAKLLYIILYFIDGCITGDQYNKDLMKFIMEQ